MRVQASLESKMSNSRQKLNWQLLTIILAGIAVAITLWLALTGKQSVLHSPSPKMTGSVPGNSPAVTILSTGKGQANPLSPNITNVSATTSGIEDLGGRMGIFNESASSLMRSNVPAKIDYGWLRIATQCISTLHGENASNIVREDAATQARLSGAELLLVGNATIDIRLAGLSRSIKSCDKLLEGSPISESERFGYRTHPGFVEFQNIARTLRNATDFNNDEVKVALSKVVAGPMFGTLESLMYNKLD